MTLELGLKGRHAIIVPAGSPLAERCANALAGEGATVLGVERAEDADLIIAIMPDNLRGEREEVLTTDRLYQAWNDGLVDFVALVQRALPGMKAQRHGRIVAVASLAARTVTSDADLDSIVSLGLLGLQKSLAGELGRHQITANSVLWDERDAAAAPDLIDSVANTVAYLCSEPAAFLTGITISVDSGRSPGVF